MHSLVSRKDYKISRNEGIQSQYFLLCNFCQNSPLTCNGGDADGRQSLRLGFVIVGVHIFSKTWWGVST